MNPSVVEMLLSFVKAYKAVLMFVTCFIVRGALWLQGYGRKANCSQMKEETDLMKKLFNALSKKLVQC